MWANRGSERDQIHRKILLLSTSASFWYCWNSFFGFTSVSLPSLEGLKKNKNLKRLKWREDISSFKWRSCEGSSSQTRSKCWNAVHSFGLGLVPSWHNFCLCSFVEEEFDFDNNGVEIYPMPELGKFYWFGTVYNQGMMEEWHSLVSSFCGLQHVTGYSFIQTLESFLYYNTCKRTSPTPLMPTEAFLHANSSHVVFAVCLVWEFFLKFKYRWLLLYLPTEEMEVIPFNFSDCWNL